MLGKLIWNDARQNKLLTGATIFFMALSAMMLALTALLCSDLLSSVNGLMERALVPDLVQMHAGELDEARIAQFVDDHPEIAQWQIGHMLNLDNSEVLLQGHSLRDSTQDNGLSVQSDGFDFLLGMDGEHPRVLPGQVHVPISYRTRYDLHEGDTMRIGNETLTIAGFLRDAQMNSMMASSKRFLVHASDYERLRSQGEEEHLVEFLLQDGASAREIGDAYTQQGLPANGPAITKRLIGMVNALSDGTTILVVFLAAVVVLLVVLLCVSFILSIRMERDKREIGMLRALGMQKRDVRRMYFVKYLVFAVLGGILGLGIASGLQGPLERQIRELYGPSANGGATILALCAVAVGEAIILLRIQSILKRADRLTALDALLAVQEQEQSMRQYLLVGLVCAACAFLMLLPQNLYTTVSSPDFVTYMGIGNAHVRLDIRQGADISLATTEIANALEGDEQVVRHAVLQTRSVPAVLPDGTASPLIVEMGDHTVFPVRYSQGTAPVGSDEIALSTLSAEEMGLSIGDTLALRMDGEETRYTVCGIYSDITNGGKTAKAADRESAQPVIWSVAYASLQDSQPSAQWMEGYPHMGADVTDIGDYVRDTYGPTLAQLQLATVGAVLIAAIVAFVVIALFLRVIVERNRDGISLQKALGFASRDVRRTYLLQGFCSAAAGVFIGLFLGSWLGEGLCGMVLRSFGADGFRFVVSWEHVLAGIPAVLLGVTILATAAGTAEIRRIRAYECCTGRE